MAGATFDPNNQMSLMKPMIISAPVINGILGVGITLTVNPGTWGNSPDSYSYQWLADGVPMVGKTAASLLTVLGNIGQALTVQVTATNQYGSTNATSAAVTIL